MDEQSASTKWRRRITKLFLQVLICLFAQALVLVLILGPINDARFEKRPLDPEPIDGNCPVHDVALKEGIVSILYGFPDFGNDYFEARRDQFPPPIRVILVAAFSKNR
jgi:hypothetical protein